MLLLIILVHQMLIGVLLLACSSFSMILILIFIFFCILIPIIMLLFILRILHFNIIIMIISIYLDEFSLISLSLFLADILLIVIRRFAEFSISKHFTCTANKIWIGVPSHSDFFFSNHTFEFFRKQIMIFLVVLSINFLTVNEVELSWHAFFLNHAYNESLNLCFVCIWIPPKVIKSLLNERFLSFTLFKLK